MTDEELLKHAVKFVFNAVPEDVKAESDETDHLDVYVEWRSPDRWAVTTAWGDCYNAKLERAGERLPSNRTDEFKAEYRFPLKEAAEIAERVSHIVRIGRYNAAEYAEWWRSLPKDS